MIDILVGGIAKNTSDIKKIATHHNLSFILISLGLLAIVKVIKDQNSRIDALEEEISELTMEGE